MGLTQSSQRRRRAMAAAAFSAKGWPAFMWSDDLYRRMKDFKMRRSVMGQRVRFYDDKNTCIEYARVAGTDRRLGQLHQRVDGPCESSTRALPVFPDAMPGSAFTKRSLGLLVPATLRSEYAEVVHPPTGRCAPYRRTSQDIWVRMEAPCSDTANEIAVARALGSPGPRPRPQGAPPRRRTPRRRTP